MRRKNEGKDTSLKKRRKTTALHWMHCLAFRHEAVMIHFCLMTQVMSILTARAEWEINTTLSLLFHLSRESTHPSFLFRAAKTLFLHTDSHTAVAYTINQTSASFCHIQYVLYFCIVCSISRLTGFKWPNSIILISVFSYYNMHQSVNSFR